MRKRDIEAAVSEVRKRLALTSEAVTFEGMYVDSVVVKFTVPYRVREDRELIREVFADLCAKFRWSMPSLYTSWGLPGDPSRTYEIELRKKTPLSHSLGPMPA